MNNGIRNNFPPPNEIAEVTKQISSMESLLCTLFADTWNRFVDVTLKNYKVHRLQSQFLHLLVLNGGSSTPTQMANMMFRSKHSTTKIIDNLEKQGLIARDYSDKDRRVTQIKITSAGLNYVTNAFAKGNETAIQVIETLDIVERKLLVNLTERMRQKMTEIINAH